MSLVYCTITPLLRCDSRSRYVRPHTQQPTATATHPPLRGMCLLTGLQGCLQALTLTLGHSIFLELQRRRGQLTSRRHMRLLACCSTSLRKSQSGRWQIPIPLQHGNRALGIQAARPCCGLLLRDISCCGPDPFVSGRLPVPSARARTHAHTTRNTQLTRHHHTSRWSN